MAVRAVFVLLFMFATAVNAQTGGASFWRKEVILTCPESGTWFKGEQTTSNTYTFTYDRQGKYSCEYGDPKVKYHFYVKGKACDNCFELDGTFLLAIIAVDLIGTVVVMIIIYRCSKKKSSNEPPHLVNKPPARSGGNRPPPGVTEYEPLNPNTRTTDVYSAVHSGMVNRTG